MDSVFREVIRVQAVLAPFVLENLGCTGNESRLFDCPVADSDDDGPADYSADDYIEEYSNPATCDPFSDSYARIACGTSSAAGMHMAESGRYQQSLLCI